MKRFISLLICLALVLSLCAGTAAASQKRVRVNTRYKLTAAPRHTVSSSSDIILSGVSEVNYYVGANTTSDELWSWNFLTDAYVTNTADLRAAGLTGMPEWTVTQTAGDRIKWFVYPEEKNADPNEPRIVVRLDDIPDHAYDAKIRMTCKWGGKTASYETTVHFKKIKLPEGLGNIEDYYIIKPGETLTLVPKVRPSGWTLPGYTLCATRNSEEFEQFAAVTDIGEKGWKLKVRKNAKSGVYNCLVALGADTLTVGRFVPFLVVNGRIDLKDVFFDGIDDQVYTGKKIKPDVDPVYEEYIHLEEGKDYTISYKNNKAVGKATVVIEGKGNFKGTKELSFRIVPAAVKISSVKAGKKTLTVSWKKGSGIDGYEIEYSQYSDFKNSKKVRVKDAATTKTVLKKLKAKRPYYIRIRTFKKVSGKKYYSSWSKVKTKTTK